MPTEDHAARPQRVPGPVQVDGLLRLAPDTLYEDDVHAPGGLLAGPGSIVVGDVYTDGPVQLAATARIGGRVRPTGEPDSGPGSAGALTRLLASAKRDRLDAERVEAALGPLAETLLDEEPEEAWTIRQVREGLLARGLSRLAPVTIEHQADGAFLVRIREQGIDPGDGPALARLAGALTRAARPGTSLTLLASPDTPGDVVIQVQA